MIPAVGFTVPFDEPIVKWLDLLSSIFVIFFLSFPPKPACSQSRIQKRGTRKLNQSVLTKETHFIPESFFQIQLINSNLKGDRV
jgi:hypothetical protein